MDDMSREDVHEAFVRVLNTVQPTHCHYDGTSKRNGPEDGSPTGMWPITTDELETSYKQGNSRYNASAGPRNPRGRGDYAFFACNLDRFNKRSPEWVAAILVHEATHISCGSFTDVQAGGHPPRFWELMAEYAKRLFRELDEIEPLIGDVDREGFLDECVNDPNSSMVDRRYETVEERKDAMRDAFTAQYRRVKCDPTTAEQTSLAGVSANTE